MRDLPQLLCTDRLKIHDFINRDDQEDAADEAEDPTRVEDCNIESLLRSTELPFQGPALVSYREFINENFKSAFNIREEIEQKII
mgnify:CR=1 FL=1